MHVMASIALWFGCAGYGCPASSQQPNPAELLKTAICDQLHIDGRASTPLHPIALPPRLACTTATRNGFPAPDPNCIPGAISPTLTIEVLRDRDFTTECIRDVAAPEEEKATTFDWYDIPHPSQTAGELRFVNWII
jgi:hypothetical protein